MLKEAGIKPVATLYHWDLPAKLQDQGGWLSEQSPEWFEAYSRRCFELFDGDVALWITFNGEGILVRAHVPTAAHALCPISADRLLTLWRRALQSHGA